MITINNNSNNNNNQSNDNNGAIVRPRVTMVHRTATITANTLIRS